jgi:hypothetical protein
VSTNYRIGFVTPAAAASAAYAAIRAPSRGMKLMEIGLSNNAATASNISLFRNTAATYAASTSTSAGQADNPSMAAGTGLVDTAWTTAPTVTAASRLLRYTLPATIGAGLIWTFPEGIFILTATPTSHIVIWNEGAAAGSVLNGYAVWGE